MKTLQQATHKHKTAGAVVVLETTAELAHVQIPASGDQFWVKRVDLTELAGWVPDKPRAKKN